MFDQPNRTAASCNTFAKVYVGLSGNAFVSGQSKTAVNRQAQGSRVKLVRPLAGE